MYIYTVKLYGVKNSSDHEGRILEEQVASVVGNSQPILWLTPPPPQYCIFTGLEQPANLILYFHTVGVLGCTYVMHNNLTKLLYHSTLLRKCGIRQIIIKCYISFLIYSMRLLLKGPCSIQVLASEAQ